MTHEAVTYYMVSQAGTDNNEVLFSESLTHILCLEAGKEGPQPSVASTTLRRSYLRAGMTD